MPAFWRVKAPLPCNHCTKLFSSGWLDSMPCQSVIASAPVSVHAGESDGKRQTMWDRESQNLAVHVSSSGPIRHVNRFQGQAVKAFTIHDRELKLRKTLALCNDYTNCLHVGWPVFIVQQFRLHALHAPVTIALRPLIILFMPTKLPGRNEAKMYHIHRITFLSFSLDATEIDSGKARTHLLRVCDCGIVSIGENDVVPANETAGS
jgi:hypothetical protein